MGGDEVEVHGGGGGSWFMVEVEVNLGSLSAMN